MEHLQLLPLQQVSIRYNSVPVVVLARITMVTWFGFNVLQGVRSDDEIFMVGNKRCITNGSAALAIIKEVSNTKNENTKYYPHSQGICDFEASSGECSEKHWEDNNWFIRRSVDAPMQHYVTDRRWEAFPVYPVVDMSNKHILLLGIKTFKSFKIPFSVRIERFKFIQISLCDEKEQRSVNCYSIVLTEMESGIWKCGALSNIDISSPPEDCQHVNNTGQAQMNSKVFSEDSWAHLSVARKDSMIEVLLGNTVIMTYYDYDEILYETKTLSAYSEGKSLWKVHDYQYLFSEEINENKLSRQIGSEIKISKGTTCISMFVAMCKTCCLRIIIIVNRDDDSTEIEGKDIPQNEMWTEHKILINTTEYVNKTLNIYQFKHQCNGNSSQGLFWAIDDIRLCEEKEYRYIQAYQEKFVCQKIGIEGNEILKIGNNEITESRVECPENTFGQSCVPCSIFGEKKEFCDDFIYCDKDRSGQNCHCTAGNIGSKCNQRCPDRYYGHGCHKACSEHCSGTCTRTSGHCPRCEMPYEGERCDKPTTFLFVYPPMVTNITSTSANVRVNFSVEAPVNTTNPPQFYYIEYVEDSDQSMNMTRTSRNQDWVTWNVAQCGLKYATDNGTKIRKLMPDTYYLVRAIPYPNTTIPVGTKGDFIKFSRFITTCTDIVTEDIVITTTNVSATIEIKWPPNHCKYGRYRLLFNNLEIRKNVSQPIMRQSLEPYTDYNCTIRNQISDIEIVKKFRTKEGVPPMVQNVTIVANANSISLNWNEPKPKRWEIIKYNIIYFYLGSSDCSCSLSAQASFNISTTHTNISLEMLKFYSKYQIMIYAVTNCGEGEGYISDYIETNQSDHISGDEMLAIDKHKVYSDSVTIFVTNISCEEMQGPIYIQGNASCNHEWCRKNVSKEVQFSVKSPSIKLTTLSAYSNYTAYLAISRDRSLWLNIGRREFQTKPSAPNSISHLEVISKDDTSISLRWKQPYPPTGVLEQYLIQYKRYYWEVFSEYVFPQSCPLWKDYHCGNLTTEIYSGYTYIIQILAINKSPTNYGPASEILSVKNIREDSQPTYGISLVWDEHNVLNITWYHPNGTNGALTSFDIRLKNTKDGSQQPVYTESVRIEKNNYSLTYTKTVPIELQACTEYKASVIVHNVHGRSLPNDSSETSPPDVPPNISIGDFETETTNSTITVHVPSVDNKTTIYDQNQKLYILVSKATETDDLVFFEEYLKRMNGTPNMNTSRIVYESIRSNQSLFFTIGENNESESSLNNPPLEPGTNYSVSIIMSNQCFRKIRLKRAKKYISTLEKMGEIDVNTGDSPVPEESNGGLWALILLFLVPLIGFGYWYKKYNKQPKGSDLLIPHESIKHESIALPRMPNPGGKVLSVKPKRSLPQALPPLSTTHSKPIRISDFQDYVKEVVTSGELGRQHGLFPRGLVKPCEYGSMAENKAKNRYKNLIAYDDTRVKLKKIRGDEYSDYINANYIDGYRKPRCYIATQGPKANTLEDFWRMIWQENVRHIVMLANVYENGKKKVEKYWPDINEDLTFGNVRVQLVSADIFANFDIRVFTVHCNNEERKINQLHFTTWPDHGVPLYSQSLVPFLQRVLKISYNPQSPIVVHCSAGVGRTGTIILSDICLRMAAGEGSIDFLAHLENIRSQRANLVDNLEQYKLAHLVVLECLFGLHTAVPCNKGMKKIVDDILIDDGIEKQMKYIMETQWQDSAMETMLEHEEVFPNYPEKNRFKEIVPRHYRVFLSKYPVDNDASFYINAVQVDGFRNPGRFISTPQPMPNTLGDFWRMVVERSCTTIISLNTLNLKDKTVCKFWPGNGEELNPVDIISVQHIKTKRLECYKVITVQVTYIRQEPFTVDILEMDNWKSNELLPNSIEEFLAFLDASEAISRNSEHVIVACYDGATASGLYLAMTFLIEKMKLEQECDVCLAVRTIRHSRIEFVTKEEQYEFLYRASVTFIAGFQSYANFTDNSLTYQGGINSADSQYGFSNRSGGENTLQDQMAGSTGSYSILDNRPPVGGVYVWGPPPPYSNPNSPARRPTQSPGRYHHVHHHNHGHESHCQMNNENNQFRNSRRTRPHFSNKDNYENTTEPEIHQPNDNSESTDTSSCVDRVSHTLPARKMKKRTDMASVKSNMQMSNRINVQNVFNQNAQEENKIGSAEHDYHEPNVQDGKAGDSQKCRFLPRLQGVENAGFQTQENSPQKPEATESEVYFADVSSCCNISVRNDGQDSSLYDEALETQKPRLISLQKPDAKDVSTSQLLQNFQENISSSTVTEDEDYLAHRMGNRQMSTRSRMPFPLPNPPELEFSTDPCIQLLPKDISQNSLCSSVQTPMTETTDDTISPEECCSYFQEKPCDQTRRGFTSASLDHYLAPDAQYEVIPDQDGYRQSSSNLTTTISGLNYDQNYYNQNPGNFGYNSSGAKNVPPKTLNLNQQTRRNIGSNISALIQNLGGNPAGLLYGDGNVDDEVQGQGCHSDGTIDSGWQSGSEKTEGRKQEAGDGSHKSVNV